MPLVPIALTSFQPLARINILGSCSRGDEDALKDSAFWVRVGASPGRRGLHPVPRPAARQPITDPDSGNHRRTAVASKARMRSHRLSKDSGEDGAFITLKPSGSGRMIGRSTFL
jgi:hypothetical protein